MVQKLDEEAGTILTIKQFCQNHPFMSESALRWRLFCDLNFRKRCTRQFGRRIYVLPCEVIAFITENAGEKKGGIKCA